MSVRSRQFYSMILAVGMLLVVLGFFLFISFFEENQRTFITALQILTIFCGALFLFFSFAFTHAPVHMFFGLLLFFSGILFTLLSSNIIPFSIKRMWPLCVTIAGLSLFISGFYKHKRILFAYLFPSVTLVFLGLLFLLFSFKIVHTSFRNFVSVIGPFLLIVSGAFLMALFFLQQRYHAITVEDEDDSIIEDDDIFLEQDELW